MTDTTFAPYVTPIDATWLNEINDHVHNDTPVSGTTVHESDVVGFIQAGTGATARTAQAKMRDIVSVKDFGAVGDGVTDDTAAIQAAINYALANAKGLYIPSGTYLITSTLTINTAWYIYGDGSSSILATADETYPIFTFDINTTTVNGCYLADVSFRKTGAVATNTASCALRFIGDTTALIQRSIFSRIRAISFYSFAKDEKLPRTTSFGLEGGLNWNIWNEINLYSLAQYGWWLTQGSGTGNTWDNIRCQTNNEASAAWFFDGSGCVVGDVLINGSHLNTTYSGAWTTAVYGKTLSGSIGVKIGSDTVYRAQWLITGCQFDAKCDVPVLMSGTGSVAYSDWRIVNNNYGGGTTVGEGLEPLLRSRVDERNSSSWESGSYIETSATGATTTDVFDIELDSYGSSLVEVSAHGLIGSVASASSYYKFNIREQAGVIYPVTYDSYESTTGQLVWSCAAVSATTGRISVTYTPAGGGTKLDFSIKATGRLFKITRI